MSLNERIGQKLRSIRESKNLSLSEAEIISQVNNKTIGAYERGEVAIQIPKLVLLLSAYGITLADFIDGIEE